MVSHWPLSAVLWPLQLLKPNSRAHRICLPYQKGECCFLLAPGVTKRNSSLSCLLSSLSDHFPDVTGPNVKPILGFRICVVTMKEQTGTRLKWQWPSCSFWPQKDTTGHKRGKDLWPLLEMPGYLNTLKLPKRETILGYVLTDKSYLKQYP